MMAREDLSCPRQRFDTVLSDVFSLSVSAWVTESAGRQEQRIIHSQDWLQLGIHGSSGNHDADHHCGSDSCFAGVCFEVVTPSLVCGLVFKRLFMLSHVSQGLVN